MIEPASGNFTAGERLCVSFDWDKVPAGEDLAATTGFASNGGNASIQVPVHKPVTPTRGEIAGYAESHGHVSIQADHFTRRIARGGAVAMFPTTLASRTAADEIRTHSPASECVVHLFHTEKPGYSCLGPPESSRN